MRAWSAALGLLLAGGVGGCAEPAAPPTEVFFWQRTELPGEGLGEHLPPSFPRETMTIGTARVVIFEAAQGARAVAALASADVLEGGAPLDEGWTWPLTAEPRLRLVWEPVTREALLAATADCAFPAGLPLAEGEITYHRATLALAVSPWTTVYEEWAALDPAFGGAWAARLVVDANAGRFFGLPLPATDVDVVCAAVSPQARTLERRNYADVARIADPTAEHRTTTVSVVSGAWAIEQTPGETEVQTESGRAVRVRQQFTARWDGDLGQATLTGTGVAERYELRVEECWGPNGIRRQSTVPRVWPELSVGAAPEACW